MNTAAKGWLCATALCIGVPALLYGHQLRNQEIRAPLRVELAQVQKRLAQLERRHTEILQATNVNTLYLLDCIVEDYKASGNLDRALYYEKVRREIAEGAD